MNMYAALLFLQGHITNADLARQLAADAGDGDDVAAAPPRQVPGRETCATHADHLTSPPRVPLPSRSA
ncbi:hypothetical protein ACLB90_01260 [Stenotrophomonas sp. LGBM10]|uniref:hypothetical protein n=1 Tax=Stenotrophomonas sp. LGBM10 TaxID=3390038 RepID=UPI00398B5BF3